MVDTANEKKGASLSEGNLGEEQELYPGSCFQDKMHSSLMRWEAWQQSPLPWPAPAAVLVLHTVAASDLEVLGIFKMSYSLERVGAVCKELLFSARSAWEATSASLSSCKHLLKSTSFY